jgi:glycosyltransferase involved in cell wall biosynthesis
MSRAAGPHIVLISNYLADEQPSMLRFANLLHDELIAQGVDAETWRPSPILGGRRTSNGGLTKWLGYADKYLLYPPSLRKSLRQRTHAPTVVHVCDHSNAMYVPWIREIPHVVTCHDLLAVRSALDEFPGSRTRWSGRRLQQMIRRGLSQAARIVCDSDATRGDVRRIVGGAADATVIYPGISPAFTPVAPEEATRRIAALRPADGNASDWHHAASHPYLLHVGGNQWYKNRAGLIDMYAALVDRMPGAPSLVVAGKPLTAELRSAIDARALHQRVVSFTAVGDGDLAALYSRAAALVFPSLAEGFGWPVAEAMACGCRVVTSDRAPMTEVAGEAATYVDPENPETAAAAIEAMLGEHDVEKRARVTSGLLRAARFSVGAMARNYVSIYQQALERRAA